LQLAPITPILQLLFAQKTFRVHIFSIPKVLAVWYEVGTKVNYPAAKLTRHSTTVVACCGNRDFWGIFEIFGVRYLSLDN
jgi:hypothetical protein